MSETEGRFIGRSRSEVKSLFLGDISRSQYFWQVAAILGSAALLIFPLTRYLWTSPVIFRDVYSLLGWSLAAILLIAFVATYISAISSRGYPWPWAVASAGFPILMIFGAFSYGQYRWEGDNAYPTEDLIDLVGYGAIILFLVLPLVLPDRARHEPAKPLARGTLTPQKVTAGGAIGVIMLVGCSAIYAGHFQDGIWLGRDQYGYFFRDHGTDDGIVIMSCGNFSGVRATSNEHPDGGGFHRDAYSDVTFDFVVAEDGQLDIRTRGRNGGLSYRDDGFNVYLLGLGNTTDDARDISGQIRSADRFMVFAVAEARSPSGELGALTSVSIVFQRRQRGAYGSDWQANMSVSSSRPELDALFGPSHISSSLMIGDCD